MRRNELQALRCPIDGKELGLSQKEKCDGDDVIECKVTCSEGHGWAVSEGMPSLAEHALNASLSEHRADPPREVCAVQRDLLDVLQSQLLHQPPEHRGICNRPIGHLHARYVEEGELDQVLELQRGPFRALDVSAQIPPADVGRGREAGRIARPPPNALE